MAIPSSTPPSNNSPGLQTVTRNRQLGNPLFQTGLVIAFVLLFGFFVLRPKYNSVAEMRNEHDKISSERATLENEQIELNRLLAQLKQSGEQIKVLDEALPLDNRPTTTALLIESYARSSGLELAQVGFEGLNEELVAGDKGLLENPYAPARQLNTAIATVVVTGQISQFQNFLTLLEASGRILDVAELEVVDGEENITFRMQLKAYEYGVKGATK